MTTMEKLGNLELRAMERGDQSIACKGAFPVQAERNPLVDEFMVWLRESSLLEQIEDNETQKRVF